MEVGLKSVTERNVTRQTLPTYRYLAQMLTRPGAEGFLGRFGASFISLQTFWPTCFSLLVVCAANQIAIFFACGPASRPFKILLALAGFIVILLDLRHPARRGLL